MYEKHIEFYFLRFYISYPFLLFLPSSPLYLLIFPFICVAITFYCLIVSYIYLETLEHLLLLLLLRHHV